jgi:hypothetical protein
MILRFKGKGILNGGQSPISVIYKSDLLYANSDRMGRLWVCVVGLYWACIILIDKSCYRWFHVL